MISPVITSALGRVMIDDVHLAYDLVLDEFDV
jgi:hypothetical protein